MVSRRAGEGQLSDYIHKYLEVHILPEKPATFLSDEASVFNFPCHDFISYRENKNVVNLMLEKKKGCIHLMQKSYMDLSFLPPRKS